MTIVNQWYKKWSVWLLGAAVAVSGLQTMLPELKEALPADWYQVAFGIILAARIIQQKNSPE